MNKHRDQRQVRGRGWALLATFLAACLLGVLLPAGSSLAQGTGEGSWGRGFDGPGATRGLDSQTGTKVSGGALKLAESAPKDLGEAVPGESAVYSMVAVGNDVYVGTGDKGHLVQYDWSEEYQEGHSGPTHYGVSNSKGQAVPATETRVTALAYDGARYLYGGTYPNGHVFSFDTSAPGKTCHDNGTPAPASGSVASMAYLGALVYLGTQSGHVYTYSGGEGGTFSDLGQPSGANPVNAMTVAGGTLYAGTAEGRLSKHAGGVFVDLGTPSAVAINALAASGTDLYIGYQDGTVRSYDTTGPGPFALLCTLPAGTPVRGLTVQGGVSYFYAGAADGHVYLYDGSLVDEGTPANSGGTPVNALAVAANNVLYGGTGTPAAGSTGRMFRLAADVYEDFGRPTSANDDDIRSASFAVKTLYLARGDRLYSFSGPGDFKDYDRPSPGVDINDIDAKVGSVYLGLQNGHLYSYNSSGHPDAFHDEGVPASPSPVTSVAVRTVQESISLIYVGLEDGRLVSGTAMSGAPLATLPGATPSIKDMYYKEGGTGTPAGLYIGGGDGHLYFWDDTTLTDEGDAGDASAVNAMAAFGNKIYTGRENGKVYSFDGSFSALGTAPSAIKSMAPGNQGVLCGTAGGRLYTQEDPGLFREEGAVPHGEPVLALCHTGTSVWIGTAQGYLSSHDDAHLGDLGEQVKKQVMVWCMTYDPGRHVFYAGTYVNAHFLVIDPATDTVTDLGRPIAGERALLDIMVTREGTVVGSTYGGTEERHNPEGGHIYTYSPEASDPASGEFIDRGRAPAPDNNWWISGLVEGPESGNLIYASTSNSAYDGVTYKEGRFFSVDKTTWAATDIGVPVPGEGTNTLVRSGEVIFGATWHPALDYQSHIYRYTPATGFTILGEAPPLDDPTCPNKYVNRLQVLGDRIYGAQNNGRMFWFDPAVLPEHWSPTNLGKPVAQSTSVYPLAPGEDGTLLCGSTGGTDSSPFPGNLSNYDPVLNEFRDLDVTSVTEAQHQDRVASIAVGTDDVGGVTFCGTRGSMMQGGMDRYAARVFRIDKCRKDFDASALSTVIDPSLVELPSTFDGHQAIGAVCPAPGQAKQVYVGTSDDSGGSGQIYLYDVMTEQVAAGPFDSGEQRVLSMCAGPDGKIYVGTGDDTADGKVKQYNPVGAQWQDLNGPAGFKGVMASTVGPDGNIYFGTGEKPGESPAILKYDVATGVLTVVPTTLSTGSRICSLLSSGGRVYGTAGSPPGATNAVEFFYYDPAGAGTFRNLGTKAAYLQETVASPVVAASDGKLYFGTGPAGKIIQCNPPYTQDSDFVAAYEWPAPIDEVTAMTAGGSTASDATIYGCTGATGRFFKFRPQGAAFTDLGPLTVGNSGARAATTDILGNPYFGTAGDTRLVRYDVNRAFQWHQLTFNKTTPPLTEAHMDICDETGAALQADVTSPHAIVGTAPVRLKARLRTSDSAQSPSFDSWEATWKLKASIDRFQYPPYSNPPGGGVYPGDTLGIWGADFGSTMGAGDVRVGDTTVVPDTWQPNFLHLTVPGSARPGDTVTVEPDSSLSLHSQPINLTVLEAPRVDAVNPPSARLGAVVEVQGSGFLAARGPSDAVLFNGVSAASYTQWSDGVIRARVPAGATTGNLSVTVNQHVSNSVPFTVVGGGGPTVTITEPSDGASLKGTVTVKATVQRQGGATPIELWVDGAKAASDASAPYTFAWNADAITDGNHTLTVKAVDGYDREGSKTITVYVDHTVPSQSQTWYFAEGCTDYGFETWVLIGNPSSEVVQARVTFMDDRGATFVRSFALAPNSRTTVNAADIAPGANVSVKVDADKQVVCERAMYWGNRVEGHSTIGATTVSRTWYFAEGSTDYGFETYVLLGNPGATSIKATVRYLFEDGTSTAREHVLAPHSRVTVNAAEEVGARDFSVKIDAGDPGIVAERSMYHGGRRCGTGTIGVRRPSLSWYLSEGSTDWGFETWLLIQRPGAGDARVTASYRTAKGETIQKVYNVKGNSRFTVDLFKEVGTTDVSTQVTSNVGVVCERSMYWNGRAAGHSTIGSPGPGKTWYLAEGCTDYGFETWILLDNPSGSTVNATLTFMKQDGMMVPVSIPLQPNARKSVDASVYVGAASFSTKVGASSPIMVERSMYWNGRSGGTGSIGAR